MSYTFCHTFSSHLAIYPFDSQQHHKVKNLISLYPMSYLAKLYLTYSPLVHCVLGQYTTVPDDQSAISATAKLIREQREQEPNPTDMVLRWCVRHLRTVALDRWTRDHLVPPFSASVHWYFAGCSGWTRMKLSVRPLVCICIWHKQ